MFLKASKYFLLFFSLFSSIQKISVFFFLFFLFDFIEMFFFNSLDSESVDNEFSFIIFDFGSYEI